MGSQFHRKNLDKYVEVLEKINKVFPNKRENRGRRKWSHCPICGSRLELYREPSRGALRAQCETKGCFIAME